MAKKITLNADTFTVPLNKLVLSPRNVRKTYAAAEIEELAASIAAPGRGLIQNLSVSEQTDARGTPTGLWEVVAGGRRFRALTLLVERKRPEPARPSPAAGSTTRTRWTPAWRRTRTARRCIRPMLVKPLQSCIRTAGASASRTSPPGSV